MPVLVFTRMDAVRQVTMDSVTHPETQLHLG